jgi:hypothetical protein
LVALFIQALVVNCEPLLEHIVEEIFGKYLWLDLDLQIFYSLTCGVPLYLDLCPCSLLVYNGSTGDARGHDWTFLADH